MPAAPTPSIADDLALALRLADEASALALDLLRRGTDSTRKADGTVVTNADLALERMLSAALASERPDDAVLGEEFGGASEAPRRWILDPIDGTRNFVAGRPDWGVHIALEDGQDVIVGVVTRPALGTRWWAGRGCGAHAGRSTGLGAPASLHVSRGDSLTEARVSGWLFDGDPRKDRLRALPGWIEPVDLDMIVRVAEGGLEAFVDGTQSQIWDRAPHVVLVEEAGGRYQDRRGGKDLDLPGALLTNGRIDGELDALLAG
jgi:histidinol-phosphatase